MTSSAPKIDERLAAESAIADWAKQARVQYGASRRAYNHAICEKLAAAAVPPLAATVLRIGSWGNPASVAEDVSSWYAQLAATINAREAQIPLAAVQQANSLVEKLWELARMQVDQSVVEPMRQQIDHSDAANRALNERILELTAQIETLAAKDTAREEQFQALQIQHQDVVNRLEESQARLRQCQQDAQQAEIGHQQKLASVLDAHAQESKARQAEHTAAMEDARKTLESIEKRAADERNNLLLRVDRSNQELVRAQSQVLALQVKLESATEARNTAKIEIATLTASTEQLRSQIQTLQAALEQSKVDNQRASEVNHQLQQRLLDLVAQMQTVASEPPPAAEPVKKHSKRK